MQTIGERLEEARKRKGISIREAAEATKIRGDYLQKFESNQFDINLAELYIRGFLRSYSQFLKLPADKIINDFNALGIGGRPRTPSREVYGRMDLSVATADGASGGDSGPAGADPSQSSHRQPAPFTRVGSSFSPSSGIDPNLVLKGSLILIGLVLAALIVWGVSSFFGGKPAATPNPTTAVTPSNPAPARQNWMLIAKVATDLTISRKNADGTLGETVYRGPLAQGRTYQLARGWHYLVVPTVPGSLEVGLGENRYPTFSDPRGFELPE